MVSVDVTGQQMVVKFGNADTRIKLQLTFKTTTYNEKNEQYFLTLITAVSPPSTVRYCIVNLIKQAWQIDAYVPDGIPEAERQKCR